MKPLGRLISKAAVEHADAITNAKGDKVELRNFGVFEVKIRKARVGRNPNAPETDVPIPQRAVVKFKPGKDMREEVIKLTPEQVEYVFMGHVLQAGAGQMTARQAAVRIRCRARSAFSCRCIPAVARSGSSAGAARPAVLAWARSVQLCRSRAWFAVRRIDRKSVV